MRKQFKAWITQDGTNNPIVDLDINSIGNIEAIYDDVGIIKLNSDGKFTGRTSCKLSTQDGGTNVTHSFNAIDLTPNTISLAIYYNGTLQDNAIQKAYLEIEVDM